MWIEVTDSFPPRRWTSDHRGSDRNSETSQSLVDTRGSWDILGGGVEVVRGAGLAGRVGAVRRNLGVGIGSLSVG